MSNHNEMETPNREEIPFPSQILARFFLVAEMPQTALHNDYIATRTTRLWGSSTIFSKNSPSVKVANLVLHFALLTKIY